MTSQMRQLARPFPDRFVKNPPQGKFGTYVPHDVVTQRLIAILGVPPSTAIVRHHYDGDMITGVDMRMTVSIDGEQVSVEESGDVENPQQKATNGARAKDAASDAYKRCAMRLGVGLHLWSGDDYVLEQWMDAANGDGGES